MQMAVDVKYVGFDIPNEFVVGYGLDYAEQYRNLRSIGDPRPARLLAERRHEDALDLVERGREPARRADLVARFPAVCPADFVRR